MATVDAAVQHHQQSGSAQLQPRALSPTTRTATTVIVEVPDKSRKSSPEKSNPYWTESPELTTKYPPRQQTSSPSSAHKAIIEQVIANAKNLLTKPQHGAPLSASNGARANTTLRKPLSPPRRVLNTPNGPIPIPATRSKSVFKKDTKSEQQSSGVTIESLCPEDRQKIATLVHELAKAETQKTKLQKMLAKEKTTLELRLKKMMEENKNVEKEKEELKSKLNHTEKLIERYELDTIHLKTELRELTGRSASQDTLDQMTQELLDNQIVSKLQSEIARLENILDNVNTRSQNNTVNRSTSPQKEMLPRSAMRKTTATATSTSHALHNQSFMSCTDYSSLSIDSFKDTSNMQKLFRKLVHKQERKARSSLPKDDPVAQKVKHLLRQTGSLPADENDSTTADFSEPILPNRIHSSAKPASSSITTSVSRGRKKTRRRLLVKERPSRRTKQYLPDDSDVSGSSSDANDYTTEGSELDIDTEIVEKEMSRLRRAKASNGDDESGSLVESSKTEVSATRTADGKYRFEWSPLNSTKEKFEFWDGGNGNGVQVKEKTKEKGKEKEKVVEKERERDREQESLPPRPPQSSQHQSHHQHHQHHAQQPLQQIPSQPLAYMAPPSQTCCPNCHTNVSTPPMLSPMMPPTQGYTNSSPLIPLVPGCRACDMLAHPPANNAPMNFQMNTIPHYELQPGNPMRPESDLNPTPVSSLHQITSITPDRLSLSSPATMVSDATITQASIHLSRPVNLSNNINTIVEEEKEDELSILKPGVGDASYLFGSDTSMAKSLVDVVLEMETEAVTKGNTKRNRKISPRTSSPVDDRNNGVGKRLSFRTEPVVTSLGGGKRSVKPILKSRTPSPVKKSVLQVNSFFEKKGLLNVDKENVDIKEKSRSGMEDIVAVIEGLNAL